MKKLIVSSLLVVLWMGSCYAQSPWLSNARANKILLEWDKPIFSSDEGFGREDATAASSVVFLTGDIVITDNFSLIVELPFSHFGLVDEERASGFDNENTVVGNLYMGGLLDINVKTPGDRLFIEFGLRVPTTPDPETNQVVAQATGLRSEMSDRFEAFIDDYWAIPLIGNYVTTFEEPVAIKLRLGTVWVNPLKFSNRFFYSKDSERTLHLLYGITGFYNASPIEISLGINGRSPFVSNRNRNFFNDGFSQLRAGVMRPFNHIVPGIYLKKPIGENYSKWVDWGYGLNIEYRW